MAEEEIQRASTKRQIARLIGNAAVPIYILGDDDRILFANDALVALLNVELDLLIGLDCSKNLPLDTSLSSMVGAMLALPPNSDRGIAAVRHLLVPGEAVPRICVSLPLDSSPLPMTLCAIKEDRGDCDALLAIRNQSQLKRLTASTDCDFSPSTDLWFLRGSSPSAVRTFKQIHAVSVDRYGVHVAGPSSSAVLAVAKWIAWKRRSDSTEKSHTHSTGGSIVVDCQLMDRTLLRGTLEMIDEQSRIKSKSQGPVVAILHQVDKLPNSLVEPLVRWKPSLPNVSLLATSSSTDLISLHPENSDWGELAANLETQVVQVPSLAQRVADIEALIVAWLEWQWKREEGEEKLRWNQEFLDAMLAYSWPGDIAEFDVVMRTATQRCQEHLLTDHDLPASLRTFPSHMQRPEPLAKIDLDSVLTQIEREIIQQAIARFPRNRTAVANQLGISRARLLRRLQQLGLEKTDATPHANSEEPIFEEWSEDSPGESDTT